MPEEPRVGGQELDAEGPESGLEEREATLADQENAGYTLLAGAAMLLATGVTLVIAFDRPLRFLGGFALAGLLLAAFGARCLTAVERGRILDAERRAALFERTGHLAFWTLLSAILIDSTWQFLPAETVRIGYAYVAGVAFLAAFAYASVAE